MNFPDGHSRKIGPFLVTGPMVKGGEVMVYFHAGKVNDRFSFQVFDKDGKPLTTAAMHKPPPNTIYIDLPKDAAYIRFRTPSKSYTADVRV